MECTGYALLALAAGLLLLLLLLLARLGRRESHWRAQGVPELGGGLPLLGHALPVLALREGVASLCGRAYATSSASMLGLRWLRTPLLLVREPELVRQVLVSEFPSVANNALHLRPALDPFLASNPFFARDHLWRETRGQLVASMSPSKLRALGRIMLRVAGRFDGYLERLVPADGAREVELEIKSVNAKFTAETVANTAFGIEAGSFDARPHPASFTRVVEALLQPGLLDGLHQMLVFHLAGLASVLRLGFLPAAVSDFLLATVADALRHRRAHGLVVDDLMQMTVDALGEAASPEAVARHVAAYFFDAYETSASIASFACFELAAHQPAQDEARRELLAVLAKRGGSLSHEALGELAYLDRLVLETIRLHPILGVSLKQCSRRLTVAGSDGHRATLEPGHLVCVPVAALHRDPAHWAAPDDFQPDRFADEAKARVDKFAFLPFGHGPRVCPGMRYGVMTVKTILATILAKYRIRSSPRTSRPVKYNQMNFLTEAQEGLWVRLSRIQEQTPA